MNYYQCLMCKSLLPTLWKVDSHLDRCTGNEGGTFTFVTGTRSAHQNRGKRPVQRILFTECHIPLVRNQIDPTFLELYERIEAKSEDGGSGSQPPTSKKFKCKFCQKEFQYTSHFHPHMETHNPMRKKHFICKEPNCGKSYYEKSKLTKHMKSHLNPTPFKCDVCHKLFRTSDGCKQHQELHLENRKRKFHCSFCSKSYFTKAVLNEHVRTHSKKRPHKCGQCEMAFKVPKHLKLHMKDVHDKIKPFQCSSCGLRCSRQTILNVHQRRNKKCYRTIKAKKAVKHEDTEEQIQMQELSFLQIKTENDFHCASEFPKEELKNEVEYNDLLFVADIKMEF